MRYALVITTPEGAFYSMPPTASDGHARFKLEKAAMWLERAYPTFKFTVTEVPEE